MARGRQYAAFVPCLPQRGVDMRSRVTIQIFLHQTRYQFFQFVKAADI